MMKHPEFDQMVALAERLRLELDSSDRKNLIGSQIIPDKSGAFDMSMQHHPIDLRFKGWCRYESTEAVEIFSFADSGCLAALEGRTVLA
jgi:hypothetical protein